jgi:hypothetical protein
VLADPPPLRNIDGRRRELRANSDKAQLAQCMRKIVKQGLAAGAYVKVDIQVDAQGAINWLNVVDTDLDKNTASCVRDVFAATRFKAGVLAHWTDKIDL